MLSTEILVTRRVYKADADFTEYRSIFYDAYSWIESFWQRRYGNGGQQVFFRDCSVFYWRLNEIREEARKISLLSPVGSSTYNFFANPEVQKATFYLEYLPELQEEDELEVDEMERELGAQWRLSPFEALMKIIDQIRNNLFHGRKTEIESPQFERNKELTRIAMAVYNLMVENLESCESSLS